MKKFFPILTKNTNYVFCDNAGGTQIPSQVLNSVNNFLTNQYVQPMGYSEFSNNLDKTIKDCEDIANTIFNCKNGKIIFGSSCSQIIYNLSKSMENYLKNSENKTNKNNNTRNQNKIIIANFGHESCITPFERIAKNTDTIIDWWNLTRVIDMENNKNNYILDYDALSNKVTKETKLIILPHVSNILGNVLDIKYIVNTVKIINPEIKILVDGVAYLPHRLIDVEDLGVDFYVASFYKFCGLRVSGLYVKDPKFLNKLDNQNHYFFDKAGPKFGQKKLEIGGIQYENLSSLIGLKDYLIDCGKIFNINNSKDSDENIKFDRNFVTTIMDRFYFYEKILVKQLDDYFKNSSEIEVIEIDTKIDFKTPIFSLKFKNYDVKNVALILNNLGIICKNSTFYCDRLFEHLSIEKSKGVLRISLFHYNTVQEIDFIKDTLSIFNVLDSKFDFAIDYGLKNVLSDDLKLSYDRLEIDKNYKTERYRAFSMLSIKNDKLEIVGNMPFFQSKEYNDYNGDVLRKYKNIEYSLIEDESFIDLCKIFNKYVEKEYNKVNEFIFVHQIRVCVSNTEKDTCIVPEGIHRDGYNIIGIVCVTRNNIKGGINFVYDNDKNIVYENKLEEGEMIIINDRKMYHDVSSINQLDENNISYRDVLIFTTLA